MRLPLDFPSEATTAGIIVETMGAVTVWRAAFGYTPDDDAGPGIGRAIARSPISACCPSPSLDSIALGSAKRSRQAMRPLDPRYLPAPATILLTLAARLSK
jgi:hypothetical protein